MCLLENSDGSLGHMFTTEAKQELGVLELREQDWKPNLEARVTSLVSHARIEM